MGNGKPTKEELDALKNGNRDPSQGKWQNQQSDFALQRLIRALTGEERRWQPKGTPSKSHLLGRAFRDFVFPWVANEINYRIKDMKDLQEQKKLDFPNKLRESVYLQAESPIDPTRVTNPQISNELLGKVPSPSTAPSESQLEIMEGLQRGDKSFAFGPAPLKDENYGSMFDALRGAIAANPTNRINPNNPSIAIRNALIPEPKPLDLLGAVDALKNVPVEDPLLEELKRRGYRQWGER